MLDPFSALGLASNIVQFVDFGGKLLSKSQELYSSVDGSTAKHKQLESLYENLQHLSQKLNASAQGTNGSVRRSQEEEALVEVAKSCTETVDELLSIIRKLKVTNGPHKKWHSFRQALKSVWRQERIDALQKRLDAINSQLNIHFAAILRYVRTRLNKFDHYFVRLLYCCACLTCLIN